jgi:hypothetical protein
LSGGGDSKGVSSGEGLHGNWSPILINNFLSTPPCSLPVPTSSIRRETEISCSIEKGRNPYPFTHLICSEGEEVEGGLGS